jgi:hypothetical protein
LWEAPGCCEEECCGGDAGGAPDVLQESGGGTRGEEGEAHPALTVVCLSPVNCWRDRIQDDQAIEVSGSRGLEGKEGKRCEVKGYLLCSFSRTTWSMETNRPGKATTILAME